MKKNYINIVGNGNIAIQDVIINLDNPDKIKKLIDEIFSKKKPDRIKVLILKKSYDISKNPDFFKEFSCDLKEKVKKTGFFRKVDWLSFVKKEKKSLVKKTFMNIWISSAFPLHFQQLSPILHYLSSGNLMLSKMNQVLNTEDMKKLLLESDNFPVKLQIPFNYTIKTNVSFTLFK